MVSKNKNNTKNYPIFITLLTIVLVGAFLVFAGGDQQQSAEAQTASNLRQKIEQLEKEIAQSQEHAEHLHGRAETLQKAVDELNGQIASAQKQINLTNLKIQEISTELKQTRKELKEQKEILAKSLREHYKMGDVSTLELFASAENFSDFFNQKEYLDRVRSNIHKSSQEVARLEKSLEKQKFEQEELLEQQQIQKSSLAAKKQEKSDLLAETRGQEAAYRDLVAGLKEKQAQIEQQLENLLSSRSLVSLGPVQQGQRIGRVGSTGYSTGPHLHFGLYNTGTGGYEDPRSGSGLKHGMIWPIDGPFYQSTPYGSVHCSQYTGCSDRDGDGVPDSYYVTHSAIDLAANQGTPVIAARGGEIVFRGWSGGLGYLVIIDHGDGYRTYYPHMCDGNNCG